MMELARRSPGNNRIVDEILRHAIQAIPGEIEADIVRTAFSSLIYDYKDFAVGIVDLDGRLVCQGNGGIPTFLANVLGLAVRDALTIYGRNDLKAGDMVISNHAGTLGQHLNNVVMFTPIFGPDTGYLIAFMCVVVHWIDIGGKSIGSSASNDTTDIFQEGFQFRCVKLRSDGLPVPEIYRIIECNSRFPDKLLGDVNSQVTGCIKGRKLFEQLLVKFGTATVLQAIDRMWAQSEAIARAAVRSIPDGVYTAESAFDNDGIDLERPIRIAVSVTVRGDEMTIDFSEMSDQVRGPFNSGANGGGVTAARIAFKYLTTPQEPTNEASFAPLIIVLPPGKFVSAAATAPMAKFSMPFPTIIDTIVRALAPAMPGKVTAAHHGNMGTHRFSGLLPANGAIFSQSDTVNGGWGASSLRDGAGPFKSLAHGDTQDIPVEAQEAVIPFLIAAKGLRTDSGGPGEYRGGLGVTKEYRIIVPTTLTLTLDRSICPPWGLNGGIQAVGASAEVHRVDGSIQRLLKVSGLPLQPGDRVFISSGGGGGYGDPHKRTRDRIDADIRAGYISEAAAREIYGATGPGVSP